MPSSSPTSPPSRPGQPRLLSGTGRRRGEDATQTSTFTATLPLHRSEPASHPAPAPDDALPRWARRFVIGGVLLAIAMPASVLLSRSMIAQEALTEQSSSKAAMVCTAGEGRAMDDSSLMGWLFGGSYFSCGEWETREARQQREREREQANYMARQRARQGLN